MESDKYKAWRGIGGREVAIFKRVSREGLPEEGTVTGSHVDIASSSSREVRARAEALGQEHAWPAHGPERRPVWLVAGSKEKSIRGDGAARRWGGHVNHGEQVMPCEGFNFALRSGKRPYSVWLSG